MKPIVICIFKLHSRVWSALEANPLHRQITGLGGQQEHPLHFYRIFSTAWSSSVKYNPQMKGQD